MTQIEICNMALTLLGQDRIVSLAEDNENVRKLNAVYDPLLKEVLRAHPWNCATKRISLAMLAEVPVYEYAYTFQLPADYLKKVKVSNGTTYIEDFKIERNKLLANESTVYLKYIFNNTDPSSYDSAFASAFAARLAAELAFPITKNPNVSQIMMAAYTGKISQAKALDAQESADEDIEGADYFIQGRF